MASSASPRRDSLDNESRLRAALSVAHAQLDAELQETVKLAAIECGFPIALVSLVLRRRQMFRAHYGLPQELVVSAGTDRCSSFCQFVVQSQQPLVVEDSHDHLELPEDLISRYGLRAYVGVPLVLDGQTVGTLCVLDLEPRPHCGEVREKLRPFALRIERRLAEVRAQTPEVSLLNEITSPAFAELRNNLMTLSLLSGQVQEACEELAAVQRLAHAHERGEITADQVVSAQQGLFRGQSLEPFLNAGNDLADLSTRMNRDVAALERLVAPRSQASRLRAAIEVACQLALHVTRTAGGVRLAGQAEEVQVLGPKEGVAALVAFVLTKLSEVAASDSRGIDLSSTRAEHDVVVRFAVPGLNPDCYRFVAREVRHVFGTQVEPMADRDAIELLLPVAG